jgi:hypothetical protein
MGKDLSLVLEYGINKEDHDIFCGVLFSIIDQDALETRIVCAYYDCYRNVIDSIFGYTDPAKI